MNTSSFVVALVLGLSAVGHAAQQPDTKPIFRPETDEFWLNLHHFMYVLGRAESKTNDSSRAEVADAPAEAERGLAALNEDERKLWRDAVTAYAAGLSLKDAVFDQEMSSVTRALADADDAAVLSATGIDSTVAATLERAAPIYRKAWWPAHRAANRTRQSSLQAPVDRHGQTILGFITKVYGMEWPADGCPVHLSRYANWSGAYSTRGNLLVVASADAGAQGLHGLETVFHEGMHQWDDQIDSVLSARALMLDKQVPPVLSHAMIFFTVGEAVRRVEPDHVSTPRSPACGSAGGCRSRPPSKKHGSRISTTVARETRRWTR